MKDIKVPMVQVRQTKEIKFKDKAGRSRIQMDFKQAFGFIPDQIIIEKVQGRNNCIVISAVIPDAILKQEKKI